LTTAFISHASYKQHNMGPDHPECPDRLDAVSDGMIAAGLDAHVAHYDAPVATHEQLAAVHDADYIAMIEAASPESGISYLDPDTAMNPHSLTAAKHAAGAVVLGTDLVLRGEARTAFCAVRPPGHHAERRRAMGFCLFNNIAVAAELAVRELGAERVFILDWDVHHGNGTAEIFRHRPDVLFASIHEGGIYPGTGPLGDVGSGAGEGYTINLPVPGGSGEELWLSLLEYIVLPVARSFEPDLILLSAGFDAHRLDPLAGCRLETDSFAEMSRHLRALAGERGTPLGAVLEGGYEPQALAGSVLATLEALGSEEPPRSAAPEAALTSRAAAQFAQYWPV
jgi:acetoin utilization deacetylase AcuC-like enzyme